MATIAMGFTVHAATGKYYGLFVGVNEFSYANYLYGCDWDTIRMMDAYTRGGFCDSANAEMIANRLATKETVRAKFQALAAKVQPGDTVLYYQSSHGGDYNDDKGSLLCLTDDTWYDYEFADDLAQFADGVRVIVVLDACNSGGMFKTVNGGASGGKKAKWNFASRVQERLNARRAVAKASGTKGVPDVAWITAADWNEVSWMDGRGSEFTHALLAGWEDGSADTDSDGYVSFGELAEYAKGNVTGSSVQSDNDTLLGDTLAGQDFDVDTYRILSANNVVYGFLGVCPASLVLPDTTVALADGAFCADDANVQNLTTVTLPAGLSTIGFQAFCGCDGLTEVTIPASVTLIDECAFMDCASLATVTFEGNVADIDLVDGLGSAFASTPWLASLYPPPANDDLENATEIPGSMSGSVVGTNINATVVSDEPLYLNWDAGATVWWKWTASEDGEVQFNTFGSDFDTIMGVYTGSAVDALTLVAENDDASGASARQSQVTFFATAGTTYYVAVGGYDLAAGEIVLEWGPSGESELEWYISRDEAVEAALMEGKRILLVSGRDTCYNTTYLRETACYDPDVLEILTEGFVLWYNDCDTDGSDVLAYIDGLGTYDLPLVCVLDPYDMDTYIARSTGFMDEDDLYDFLVNLADWEPTGFALDIEDGWVNGYFGEIPEGEMVDLEIPDGVEGIEDGAFEGLAGLRSLYIPASVTYIGEYAFADCSDLEEIIFEEKESELIEDSWIDGMTGETVEYSCIGFDETLEIGMGAFSGCEALTWLEIPAHVGYVGESAFEDCTALESVSFLSDDSVTSSCLEIGGGAFCGCESLMEVYFEDRPFDTENDIWNEVYIYESAFEDCEALVDLYLGEGVREIGEYAFSCIGIESLEVPVSCYYIGNYAFAYCENLEDVYFYSDDVYGEGYLEVDIESAFAETPWLTAPPDNDNFADAVELVGESGYASGKNRNATVEEGEIHECSSTATVWYKWTAPMTGTVLFGVNADYDSILGVYAGTSISSLELIAFNDDIDYYSSAVAVDAVEGNTYYIVVGGYGSSEGAFGLEWMPYEYEIEFEISEDGVLTGFDYNVVMPSTITIPEGVTAIAEDVFSENGDIVTVNLPSTLESIGEYAFGWCYNLQAVNGLTDAIEEGHLAFWATPFDEARPFGLDIVDGSVMGFHGHPCPSALEIPEGVTNIAEWAFGYWEYARWEEVYDAVDDEWYEYEHSALTNLQSVVISASVEAIGECAFEDCTNLVSVSIGNPEIKIDGSAFNGCEKLAINIEKEGYTLVGWDLWRERNPGHMERYWDEVGGSNVYEYVEFEPEIMPTGTVVRVADITPLVYGMPTDQMRTNWVWNAETGDYDIKIYVVTNGLEGVWATPAWEVNRYTLTFDSDGGSEVAPITQDYDTAVMPPADPTLLGYTFAGWNPAVPEKMPAADMKLSAQWTPNRYTVTFDANGGTGSMAAQEFVYDEEQLLSECAFKRPAHEFLGWSLAADSDDIAYFNGENVLNLTSLAGDNITFYAVWERTSLWTPVGGRNPVGGVVDPGDAAMTGDAAESYDGYVQTADGQVVGTIQVKVAKAKLNKNTQSLSAKVTVTIQLLGEKKQTVKGNVDVATGAFAGKDGRGRALNLLLGANSLSGTYGSYVIDGAQNKFKTKKATAKALGDAALAQRKGTWSVAWQDAVGWNGVSLMVGAKGKVTIAGVLANGTKVSAISQLLVGEGAVCVIPVVITKKASLAFNVWLTEAGVEVVGLDGNVVAGRVNGLRAGAVFNLDAAAFTAYWRKAVLPYLPDGVSVAQSGTKWSVASGAKAGKVVFKKGTTEVDEEKLGANPSGLKLTYTAKTGTFKGTFKAYVLEGGKPKATTVNVTGVLVDGVGYGTVAIKKVVGGVPVTVGLAE